MTDGHLPFDYDPDQARYLPDFERVTAKSRPAWLRTEAAVALARIRRFRDRLDRATATARDCPLTCSMAGCARPAQWHHVYDRAIFGALAELGPLVLLCQECHDLLHEGHRIYYSTEAGRRING